MPETVIIPLDGSELAERALPRAAEVAAHTGAALVPMMVVQEPSEDDFSYLKSAVADFEVSTGEPYLIASTDPVECITNAGEGDGALVVMTSHGSTGLRRALLGSVAEGVVRRLRRPLLVVGPRCHADRPIAGGNVVVPLDGSSHAERILDPLVDWCRRLDLEAWAVSVVDPAVNGARPGTGPIDSSYVRRVSADLAAKDVRTAWEVLHAGDPARPLMTFSLGLRAALIAMTTHGRTGLTRVALGSVAAKIVHEAECPVLLLRPDLDPQGRQPPAAS